MRASNLLAATLLSLSASLAHGQDEGDKQRRSGFWISFGAGAGSMGVDCDGCSGDRETGFSGYLRLGGTVSRVVLIGGETNGWYKRENDIDGSIGFASAMVYVYPAPSAGFFVKGGVGYAALLLSGEDDELQSRGFGLQGGLGYDIRVARNFSLTPYLNYLHTLAADAELNGESLGEELNPNVLQVGLGFTFH